MISKEEKQRYCEATKCSDCVGWHKYCNAECCKLILININRAEMDKSGKYMSVHPGNISVDLIKYYKLRDVRYIRGFLRFRRDRLKIIGGKIFYYHSCSRLDGVLCLDHPHKKPEICKSLTLETSQLPNQKFVLTENCLFKYKLKEVKQDD